MGNIVIRHYLYNNNSNNINFILETLDIYWDTI